VFSRKRRNGFWHERGVRLGKRTVQPLQTPEMQKAALPSNRKGCCARKNSEKERKGTSEVSLTKKNWIHNNARTVGEKKLFASGRWKRERLSKPPHSRRRKRQLDIEFHGKKERRPSELSCNSKQGKGRTRQVAIRLLEGNSGPTSVVKENAMT